MPSSARDLEFRRKRFGCPNCGTLYLRPGLKHSLEAQQ